MFEFHSRPARRWSAATGPCPSSAIACCLGSSPSSRWTSRTQCGLRTEHLYEAEPFQQLATGSCSIAPSSAGSASHCQRTQALPQGSGPTHHRSLSLLHHCSSLSVNQFEHAPLQHLSSRCNTDCGEGETRIHGNGFVAARRRTTWWWKHALFCCLGPRGRCQRRNGWRLHGISMACECQGL